MAEALLRFDALTSRWEYSTIAVDAWASTESINEVLVVARDSGGRLAGFVFDADPEVPAFGDALNFIEREFGDEVAGRVRQVPLADIELTMATAGTLAQRSSEEIDIMRPSPRLQSAASDVMISDDSVAGVVTVTMTVPWWARFARPWVTVRRRGKRDILLTGPLKVRGRTARATLRYGMPYPGSTLTADVVKGPQSSWLRGVIVGVVSAAVIVAAFLVSGRTWPTSGDATQDPVIEDATQAVMLNLGENFQPEGCWTSGKTILISDGYGFNVDTQMPKVFAALGSVWPGYPNTNEVVLLSSQVISESQMTFVVPTANDFDASVPGAAQVNDLSGQQLQFVWSLSGEYQPGGPNIPQLLCESAATTDSATSSDANAETAATATTTTVASATTVGPTIEVQPSQECDGRFCVLGVLFASGRSCMQPGDTFTQSGDGFSPDIGFPLVYFIPGLVRPPLPGGPVLRVPATVVSSTELRGVVPAASDFPFPPVAGQPVTIVVSNGAYGPSTWGSTAHQWCG
ncbi:MAG: hypothetical protein ACO24R_06440 [Ilumatobacteraceae bacterium]